MQTIVQMLQAQLQEALHDVFAAELPPSSPLLEPEVVQSTQLQFGHYQCNNSLKIAKEIRKNPQEVAKRLLGALTSKPLTILSRVEVAGPGFINMTIDSKFLSQQMDEMLKDSHLGVPMPKCRKKVIVEFSSPNIAKELHVGHLRSTIIGECLARLFEFLGEDVLRLNHVGDWGTQFGMLIGYLKRFHAKVLTGEEKTDLPHLMQWYKESKKMFDEDPDFKKQSQLEVVSLQGGDPLSLKAWSMICEISRRAFQEIYDLMGVRLEERGESFYNPMLFDVVVDLEKKGLITVSDGAKCLFLDGFVSREGTPLPMIVQKSDGGYNYATTDMAALKHRVEKEKADRIIYVTDAGQSLHFQQVFKAGEKAGYYNTQSVQLDHVGFGVVLGPDGKKFKTRSGDTEKLIDLLLEAIKKAKEIVDVRLSDLPEDEKNNLAKALGIGAVKYSDLSCHRVKDYVFSYDRMLKFEGNTAAFLLYAYVRIQGIKRKGGKQIANLLADNHIILEHPSEVALALHIRQFGETLYAMARDLLPNRLTDYLYELAERFNAFYRDCRVEGSKEENSRLLLCEASARVLEKGLYILGLQTVPRM